MNELLAIGWIVWVVTMIWAMRKDWEGWQRRKTMDRKLSDKIREARQDEERLYVPGDTERRGIIAGLRYAEEMAEDYEREMARIGR